MNVLIVEDNPQLGALLCQALSDQGYEHKHFTTLQELSEWTSEHTSDLIILDRMLPDGDGLEACRGLRNRGVMTPVLILTALSEPQQRVSGLDAGADDYLSKPFDLDELLARVRALIRRGSGEATKLEYEDLQMDLTRRTVSRAGRQIPLTQREFALLEFLIRRKDRVLTRATIGTHVWDTNFEPGSNVIDVYVSLLRRKIDKGFAKPLIRTVTGAGYMLSASA